MNSNEIERYLQRLQEELAGMDVIGEIVLHGGAAMVLAHKARVSTKDVDVVKKLIPPKTRFAIEELFQNMASHE